ncbi:MAG: hypothetical protein MUF09_06950 [Candidatus Nanopelagicales bacterium]|jgi:hypothetical protein|nr:hypothetical protein [Candidatus Nanopelagicales bacterium]
MTAHDPAASVVSSGPVGTVAAEAAAWGLVQEPVAPAPVTVPGGGLTMLGSDDEGTACADGACIVAMVDPAG